MAKVEKACLLTQLHLSLLLLGDIDVGSDHADRTAGVIATHLPSRADEVQAVIEKDAVFRFVRFDAIDGVS
jgi:hypothetical protein